MSTVEAIRMPVQIEIPVTQGDKVKALRSALKDRVNTIVEPRSVEELNAEAKQRSALRQAHIDAVKERAALETQRVEEAAARKLRNEEAEVERIVGKMAAAASKLESRRQSQSEKREADKAKRIALAEAVMSARSRASVTALKKGVANAERGEQAVAKREQRLAEVAERGSAEVKHALEVVSERKAKEEEAAASASERLQQRLAAATERRNDAVIGQEDAKAKAKAVAATRAAQDFHLEMKAVKAAAVMQAATAKREAILGTIQDAVKLFNEHAADVAAAVRANAEGTDELTAKNRAAVYEKLVAAEVARAMVLRKKAPSTKNQLYHPEVIVIKPRAKADAAAVPPKPPAALLKRLTTVHQKLLLSASSRQLGAHARREAKETELHKASIKRITRVAAAEQRRAAKKASTLAELSGRDVRVEMARAHKEQEHMGLLAKEMALATMVHANRLAAEEELRLKAAENQDKVDAATERRQANLRKRAKVGVVAVRQSASKSRRDALAALAIKHGELNQTRCMQAETTRQAELGNRVFNAQELSQPKSGRFEPVE